MADTAMYFDELVSAKYMGLAWEEVANSEAADYLGATRFGFLKQMPLDLSWLKGSSGVPVAISPAAYDAEVALRGRIGAAKIETEMPLFREGIQLTEKDRRDLQNARALGDSYLRDVLARIFNDSNNLVRGAKVIPEIMIWQLLAPADGKPKISIAGNDINYAYDYDPNGTWFANNFIDCSSTPWSGEKATPIDNINSAVNLAKAKGVNPGYSIMSRKTMLELMNSEQVRGAILAQNPTANIYVTEAATKNVVENLTGVRPIVYNTVYKTNDGTTKPFYPDKVVTLIPEGQLGNTVYAVTPEEFDLNNDPTKNVAIVEGGIAISVVPTSLMPRRFATYVSEIVLPSYERMDEVYVLKVDA